MATYNKTDHKRKPYAAQTCPKQQNNSKLQKKKKENHMISSIGPPQIMNSMFEFEVYFALYSSFLSTFV